MDAVNEASTVCDDGLSMTTNTSGEDTEHILQVAWFPDPNNNHHRLSLPITIELATMSEEDDQSEALRNVLLQHLEKETDAADKIHAELQQQNAALQQQNAALQQQNAALQQQNALQREQVGSQRKTILAMMKFEPRKAKPLSEHLQKSTQKDSTSASDVLSGSNDSSCVLPQFVDSFNVIFGTSFSLSEKKDDAESNSSDCPVLKEPKEKYDKSKYVFLEVFARMVTRVLETKLDNSAEKTGLDSKFCESMLQKLVETRRKNESQATQSNNNNRGSGRQALQTNTNAGRRFPFFRFKGNPSHDV